LIVTLLFKILQALAGIVSTLALYLAAAGQWLLLGTSTPLILATIMAAIHYRHRPDLTMKIARSRSSAWRSEGYSETESPRTNARSSE
jgi:hypothetical protein